MRPRRWRCWQAARGERPASLTTIEDIIDAAGMAPRIEALLPAGVRHRQLKARTLLVGMMLTVADDRPAHLTRVHRALTGLPERRPGAARRDRGLEDRPAPAHLPPDRAHLRPVTGALAKDEPDGAPSGPAAGRLRRPAGSQHPRRAQDASPSLAADWTDAETWSRPPRHGTTECADPEAVLGAPQQQPARPQGRDVLRLLPLGRHHGRARRTARPCPSWPAG